jgi:hypothetical protein
MLLIVISGEVMTTKVGPSVTGTRCHPHRFRPRRDLGAAAERAVITFLRDASMTTAEREATGPLFGAGGRGWRGVYRIEG